MLTSDFDYELPQESIAAYPLERRDASRLMVLDRATEATESRIFHDVPDLLRTGDCLVLNDSRVIPARLLGRRATGGSAEILLIEKIEGTSWLAWVKPARKLDAGSTVEIVDSAGRTSGVARIGEEVEDGARMVTLDLQGGDLIAGIPLSTGLIPLPPYILAARKRHPTDAARAGEEDCERYQTVYAREWGSVAAPTAGLHFTPELLSEVERRGVEIRRVTLHVGPGTFAPVKSGDPAQHRMHRERFSIDSENAGAIRRAAEDPRRRVVAVGTTVTRVLETLAARPEGITHYEGATELLILPGHKFRAVDALITNFHLPRSTLLMLVCAFAGRDNTLAAYDRAIREGYRFYSYGDAMLIQ